MILEVLLVDRHVLKDAFGLAIMVELRQGVRIRPSLRRWMAIKRLDLLYAREELVLESAGKLGDLNMVVLFLLFWLVALATPASG